MHSVRLEPTKMILIGTRTTYQATGDADIKNYIFNHIYQQYMVLLSMVPRITHIHTSTRLYRCCGCIAYRGCLDWL